MKEMMVRTLSGIVYLAIMVCGTVVLPPLFPVLVAFVMLMCMLEFYHMTIGRETLRMEQEYAFATCLVLMMLLVMHYLTGIPFAFVSLCILPLLWIGVRRLFDNQGWMLDKLVYIYTGILYIGLPIALVPLVYYGENGAFHGYLLLSLFILIWSGDVGAYVIGTALGQRPESRKLAPHISPKKSWWGFAGEVLFACTAAVVLHYLGWLEFSLAHCMVLGALVATGAVLGDLVESVWKRHCGVKDSGNIMPGHGGMLDRFDSSLIAIPLASVYLSCFGLL